VFSTWYSLDDERSWIAGPSYVRADLPASLQLGLMTNAVGPPDGLRAEVDFVRFGVPTTQADCTAPLAPRGPGPGPTAPTLRFTGPSGAAPLPLGTATTLTLDAQDVDGWVTHVQVYKDGAPVAALTQAPFVVPFVAQAPGRHVFTAIATDDSGRVGAATPLVLHVLDDDASLASKSDALDDPSSLDAWATLPGSRIASIDVGLSAAGKLTLIPEPILRHAWYADDTAPFLYKALTGDFVVEVDVRAGRTTDPTLAPRGAFGAAGLMLRDPDSSSPGRQRYVLYTVGQQHAGVAREAKTTVAAAGGSASTLFLNATPGGVSAARLRLCRVGPEVRFFYRHPGAATWTEEGYAAGTLRLGNGAGAPTPGVHGSAAGTPIRFVRTDLPPTVQVGLIAGTWAPPHETRAELDDVRFGAVQGPADCLRALPAPSPGVHTPAPDAGAAAPDAGAVVAPPDGGFAPDAVAPPAAPDGGFAPDVAAPPAAPDGGFAPDAVAPPAAPDGGFAPDVAAPPAAPDAGFVADAGSAADAGAPNPPAAPSLLAPAAANLGRWTWVSIPGSLCRDGSATGVGVKLRPGATRTMVFLDAGGACFNAQTCATNAARFGEPEFTTWRGGAGNAGLFSDAASSPVAGWNLVYVPYCTGDVHAGGVRDRDVPGGPARQQFVGRENVARAVAALTTHFGGTQAQVLLAGSSAGGFGATYNYGRVADAFAPTPVTLLSDSSLAVTDDAALAPCLRRQWDTLWGLDAGVPAGCAACRAPDGHGADDLPAYWPTAYPSGRFAVISSQADAILRQFWGFGAASCTGYAQVSSAVFTQAATRARDEVLIPTGAWSTYFVPGDGHVFLRDPQLGQTSVGGWTPAAFVREITTGRVLQVQ
jgi:hypothetical protein